MQKNEAAIREDICEIGRRIWHRGYCAGNGGNISVRISPETILCTPTGVSKGFMKPEEICTVDLSGKQIAGPKPCTSEVKLHLEIYKARPDIHAVVHCHAPHLTAFAISRMDVPRGVYPEAEVIVGAIPVARFYPPGSKELAESVKPYVSGSAVLLANHGAVTWAGTLEEAYFKMESAETYTQILMLAKQIGGPAILSAEELKAIRG
jgi:L-fuculose-phosphate aldolase